MAYPPVVPKCKDCLCYNCGNFNCEQCVGKPETCDPKYKDCEDFFEGEDFLL